MSFLKSEKIAQLRMRYFVFHFSVPIVFTLTTCFLLCVFILLYFTSVDNQSNTQQVGLLFLYILSTFTELWSIIIMIDLVVNARLSHTIKSESNGRDSAPLLDFGNLKEEEDSELVDKVNMQAELQKRDRYNRHA